MPKEKKKLTIKELKAIAPLADVYELSQFRRYIVVIKKPSIIGMDQSMAVGIAKEVARIMVEHKIPVQILANVDVNDVKFYEVS